MRTVVALTRGGKKVENRLIGKSEPISLLLLDIDSFKAYNDLYGHLAGDTCIQQIAGILDDMPWGSYDLPARYGGEEFVVLLPGKDLEQAVDVAARIHEAVKNAHIPHKGSFISDYLTISIGVASTNVTVQDSSSHLIKEADIALYEAKKNGRNQIKIYQSQTSNVKNVKYLARTSSDHSDDCLSLLYLVG